VELDVAPLVEAVAGVTGAGVVLIGHSLGGLVAALVAARLPRAVAAVVAIASPFAVGVDQPLVRLGARLWVALAESGPLREVAHGEAMGRALLAGRRLKDRLDLPPRIRSWLPGSMEPQVEAEFVAGDAREPGFPGLVRDLSRLAIGRSPEGMDIGRELGAVRAPALVVAANRDQLAPPAAVRALFEALAAADRTWLSVGDDVSSFGHVDVVLGRDAPRRVWSPILDWLDEKVGDGGADSG
jgi:pimeloyl-ACP methyl ester carboxylesterase